MDWTKHGNNIFDAHHDTYSLYNLHSADGIVFVWTLDGHIPRQIYEKHTKRGDFYSSHIHSGKYLHLNHAIMSKLNRSGYVSCVD